MTPAEEFVERTTRSSGVPSRVEDPTTIGRIATLVAVAVAANKETAPVIETSGTVKEARRVRDERPL